MRKIIGFMAIALGCLYPILVSAQTPLTDLNWKPYWGDEFNDSAGTHAIKKNLWNYQHNNANLDVPPIYAWGDTDIYARVDSGILKLTSKALDTTTWNWKLDSMFNVQYVGARIVSNTFVRWGYVEARWRVRHGDGSIPDSITMKGVSPSFWLWSDARNTDVPNNTPNHNAHNEIDISECTRGQFHWNQPGHNMHYQDSIYEGAPYYSYLSEYYNPRYAYSGIDFWNWHTYGVEWDSTQVKYYLDNVLIHRINNGDRPYDSISPINPPCTVCYSPSNFYHIPSLRHMAIILWIEPRISKLDTLLGPKGYYKEYPNGFNLWPINMEVDYVHVFKYNQDCGGSYVAATNYNFSTYTHKVWDYFVVGGAGGSAIVQSNQNISIRAVDDIILNEGFEVKMGGLFYADVNPCNNQ